jgi:hypothetical protein
MLTDQQMEAAKEFVINNVANLYNPEDANQARELVEYLDYLRGLDAEIVIGMAMDWESYRPAPIMRGHGCVPKLENRAQQMLRDGMFPPVE